MMTIMVEQTKGYLQAWSRGFRWGVVLCLLASIIQLDRVHAEEYRYTLGSGDQIRVTVFGHDDLSGEFEVGASGSVALPLIGNVKAKGSTLEELEASIIDLLKPDYLKNPRVAVNVLNYRPFYIFGEVKAPGGYAYVGGMRIVEAIALAGGFTYRASENDVLIQRADDTSGNKVEANQNTIVLPGDVIEVPQRFF